MNRNAAVRLSIASSVALVLLFLGGAAQVAQRSNTPAETPSTEIIELSNTPQEIVADSPAVTSDTRSTEEVIADDDTGSVRRAAVEWVKNKYPDAKVDGVFMLAFAKGNLYLAGADTKFDGDRRETVDVLVRRYTRRGGNQYFRAEGLGKDEAERLRQKADFDADMTKEASNLNHDLAWDDDDECRR